MTQSIIDEIRERTGASSALYPSAWSVRVAISAVVLLGLVVASPAHADPATRVERLHEALLEAMRNATELGYSGRYALLAPVIREAYDLPFMAEKALGRHWRARSESERARFVRGFERFTIWNYAKRFDAYDGERFELLGSEPWTQGTLRVRTRLLRSNGAPIQLDYRLLLRGGSWRIIDVYLNGTVSELALRRAEYSSVVRRKGFPELLRALEQKVPPPAEPELGDGP